MYNDPKKSPYRGQLIFIVVMLLPSVAITGLLYHIIARWQPQFGFALNWASAKTLGCGAGMLVHLSCWLLGSFDDDFAAVKTRVSEFFENVFLSVRMAFTGYVEDIKTLGVAFWIDMVVILLNFGVFLDALTDFIELYGRF